MRVARWLLVLVVCLAAAFSWLLHAESASAAGVTHLRVDAYLKADGSAFVVENIKGYVSASQGVVLVREIPVGDGVPLASVSLTRDGVLASAFVEYVGGVARVWDTDPPASPGKYRVEYTVPSALTVSAGEILWKWDVVSATTAVRQVVLGVESEVELAGVECSWGTVQSRSLCVALNGSRFSAGPLTASDSVSVQARLAPGHGFVIDRGKVYPPGTPTAPTSPSLWWLLAFPAGFAAAFAASGLARERTYSSPVLFAPPDGLPPLPLGAALDDEVTVSASTVAGALLDLAARGWVKVSVVEGLPVLSWTGTGQGDLSPAEVALVDAVLPGRDRVVLSSGTLTGTASDLARVRTLARSQAGVQPHPRPTMLRWVWRAVGVFCLGAAALVAYVWAGAGFGGFVLLCGLGTGFVVSGYRVRLLRSGGEVRLRRAAAGFRELLATPGARRRADLVGELGYASGDVEASLLAYATVLGVASAWREAFPDMELVNLTAFFSTEPIGSPVPEGPR